MYIVSEAPKYIYMYIYSVRGTKFPNLNVSRLVLQLILSNPLKPGVMSSMKMQQATLQLYVSDHHFIANCGAAYVRGLTILSLFFHLCIHTHIYIYIYISRQDLLYKFYDETFIFRLVFGCLYSWENLICGQLLVASLAREVTNCRN